MTTSTTGVIPDEIRQALERLLDVLREEYRLPDHDPLVKAVEKAIETESREAFRELEDLLRHAGDGSSARRA